MGTEWVEPTDEKRAGHGTFGRPKTDYDLFMESEGVPIYRDFGVQRCQDLPMKPWDRLGGQRDLCPAVWYRGDLGDVCGGDSTA